jgi:hypothetical protein
VWKLTLALCGTTDRSLVDYATATHLELAKTTYRVSEDAARVLTILAESGA